MKVKGNIVIREDFEKKVFKQAIFNNEETIEPFTKAFLYDKAIDARFYRMYSDGEIPLSFKKLYHGYFFVEGKVEATSYSYIKETKNEFDEIIFSTFNGFVDQEINLYDNCLYQNNLWYNGELLYEFEDFNDYLTEEQLFIQQKAYSEFLAELDYKLVNDIKDNLYKKHLINEKSPLEKINLDPISNVNYQKKYLFLEPIMEISFDFQDNKKLRKYKNYVSLVTNKVVGELDFPLENQFKEFQKRNKPGFFSDIRLSDEDLEYYLKEKYTLSLIVNEEFNKLTEDEIIDRAVLYLNNKQIEEGLLYIKKAFYLFGSRRVANAFVILARFYLQKETLDNKKAMYYLNLVKGTDGEACYLLGGIMEAGLIEGVDYLEEALHYYLQAVKKKNGNAAYRLYHYYSSIRYNDNSLATRYLKIAAKYKNEKALNIYGR